MGENQIAVSALRELLQDGSRSAHGGVAQAGLQALTQIACVGDKQATVAAAAVLDHKDNEVRRMSMDVLVQAGKNDKGVVAVLQQRAADSCPVIAREALFALAAVSTTGDIDVVATMTTALNHAKPEVRRGAAEVLGRVAEKDNAQIIDVLTTTLNDHHSGVADSACRALAHVTSQCGRAASAALVSNATRDVLRQFRPTQQRRK